MNIPNKNVILNKRNVFAMVVHNQILPGHIIVCPKEPVPHYRDLNTEQLFEISLAVHYLTQAVQTVNGTDSATVSIQEGQGAGQSINHLHVHIVPRTSADKFSDNDLIYSELAKFDET